MPRIIIQAIPHGGERADITLSERVAAANLNAPHYSAQLLERLTWPPLTPRHSSSSAGSPEASSG